MEALIWIGASIWAACQIVGLIFGVSFILFVLYCYWRGTK